MQQNTLSFHGILVGLKLAIDELLAEVESVILLSNKLFASRKGEQVTTALSALTHQHARLQKKQKKSAIHLLEKL